LVTDGHMVTLRSGSIALDLRRIKTISLGDLASQDISELEDIVRLFRGEFLDDLSLPRCPKFESWRISWLDEVNLFKARLLRALIDRLQGDASRALPYAHALHELHPQDSAIAAANKVLAERARTEAVKASSFKPPEERTDAPPMKTSSVGPKPTSSLPIDIRFCTSKDGARIAYSVMGEGPPIVKTATWLSHLQFDWESPIWRHWIEGLAAQTRLVSYDKRGSGLSDRELGDLSFETMLLDLESVVDHAQLDRFTLLG